MSAARSRNISSSMLRNMFSNMVEVSTSACSAQVPASMAALMPSTRPGSWASMMWPLMISASFSPTVTFMRSACASVFLQKTSSASL